MFSPHKATRRLTLPFNQRLIHPLKPTGRAGPATVKTASATVPASAYTVTMIRELFVLSAPILEVEVGGQTIAITAEHPFFVYGIGWTAAGDLQVGQLLAGKDGEWTPVTAVNPTGRRDTVYNLCVSVAHTYFVGADDWGFAVWLQNTYEIAEENGKWFVKLANVDEAIKTFDSKEDLLNFYRKNSLDDVLKHLNAPIPFGSEQGAAFLRSRADVLLPYYPNSHRGHCGCHQRAE